MSDEHVALLERYQPYHGCAWIERLAELSNADKHRHLLDLVGRVGLKHERRGWSVPDEEAVQDEEGLYVGSRS